MRGSDNLSEYHSSSSAAKIEMFQDQSKTELLWNKIIERWRQSGIRIRSGVDRDSIASFEIKYGVLLPNDVRNYFMSADGTGDEMDVDLYRFWPLSEVKPVHEQLKDTEHFSYPDRYSYPNCYVFADHCIDCWDYAILLNTDKNQSAPVFRVTGSDQPGEQMSASFREFMARYASDPSSII